MSNTKTSTKQTDATAATTRTTTASKPIGYGFGPPRGGGAVQRPARSGASSIRSSLLRLGCPVPTGWDERVAEIEAGTTPPADAPVFDRAALARLMVDRHRAGRDPIKDPEVREQLARQALVGLNLRPDLGKAVEDDYALLVAAHHDQVMEELADVVFAANSDIETARSKLGGHRFRDAINGRQAGLPPDLLQHAAAVSAGLSRLSTVSQCWVGLASFMGFGGANHRGQLLMLFDLSLDEVENLRGATIPAAIEAGHQPVLVDYPGWQQRMKGWDKRRAERVEEGRQNFRRWAAGGQVAPR